MQTFFFLSPRPLYFFILNSISSSSDPVGGRCEEVFDRAQGVYAEALSRRKRYDQEIMWSWRGKALALREPELAWPSEVNREMKRLVNKKAQGFSMRSGRIKQGQRWNKHKTGSGCLPFHQSDKRSTSFIPLFVFWWRCCLLWLRNVFRECHLQETSFSHHSFTSFFICIFLHFHFQKAFLFFCV